MGASTDTDVLTFRMAAKHLEEKVCPVTGCHSTCCSLSAHRVSEERHQAFIELFKPELPDDPARQHHWWAPTDEQDGARVLALCFMAAMVEAGDV